MADLVLHVLDASAPDDRLQEMIESVDAVLQRSARTRCRSSSC